MAANSKIEWTDHTFNAWIGCDEVSPACDFCYAKDLSQRYGWAKWGPKEPRKRTSVEYWKQPLRWDRAAAAAGERHRVFALSLGDVFDKRVPLQWQMDLGAVIDQTPNLDWLLLTKRIQNARRMLDAMFPALHLKGPRPNVWLGITGENEKEYERRWAILSNIPAVVRFVSGEPLYERYDLDSVSETVPDWFIAGGASGRDHRPTPDGTFEYMQEQCAGLGVAFFMKQMFRKAPIPARLNIRQFPTARAA